ncbi:MAG: hypothetical protein ACREOG_20435 [Gemmatimonadaceae bacterium]
MSAATADLHLQTSFSSIVALISDSRRAALSQLLAERTLLPSEVLLFAADTDELKRTVTSGSLVLIEGSRLGELAASPRVRDASGPARDRVVAPVVELGGIVDEWLARLPSPTGAALREALRAPRAWSVKRVAHAAGVSTRQLVRHCHRGGCTVAPKDLLLAARLAAAQTLLRGPRTVTNSDLAHACGWVDARSLRSSLRRAGLQSSAALAQICHGRATVSDIVSRIHDVRA